MNIRIFVFGSNLAGAHGAGAALHAVEQYDAEYGVGAGPTGRAYAIPTKDERIRTLPLDRIKPYAIQFNLYAWRLYADRANVEFLVTRIGCGLAGYGDEDMAPMFTHLPPSCILPRQWEPYMSDIHNVRFHDESK